MPWKHFSKKQVKRTEVTFSLSQMSRVNLLILPWREKGGWDSIVSEVNNEVYQKWSTASRAHTPSHLGEHHPACSAILHFVPWNPLQTSSKTSAEKLQLDFSQLRQLLRRTPTTSPQNSGNFSAELQPALYIIYNIIEASGVKRM